MTLDKEKFPVRAMWEENGFTMEIEGGETVVLNTDWTVGEPMMLADIGGKEVTVQVGEGRFREAYTCTSGASRGAHGKLEMANLKVLARRHRSFLRLSIQWSVNEVNHSGDDVQVVPCHHYLVVLNCSSDDAQVVPCHRYLVVFHPSVEQ